MLSVTCRRTPNCDPFSNVLASTQRIIEAGLTEVCSSPCRGFVSVSLRFVEKKKKIDDEKSSALLKSRSDWCSVPAFPNTRPGTNPWCGETELKVAFRLTLAPVSGYHAHEPSLNGT